VDFSASVGCSRLSFLLVCLSYDVLSCRFCYGLDAVFPSARFPYCEKSFFLPLGFIFGLAVSYLTSSCCLGFVWCLFLTYFFLHSGLFDASTGVRQAFVSIGCNVNNFKG